MNKKLLSKIVIISGIVLVGIYVFFLILPFILNFFIDKFTPQIVGEINKATGLNASVEEIKIVTTPKLTAGVKVKKFEIHTPKNEPVLSADDFQVKMSLLPLFIKNIRIDAIQLKQADIVLSFDKNGDLDLLQYLPVQEENTQEENVEPMQLPLGFKLSNHLPDIHVGGYKLTLMQNTDTFILNGNKTDITDFIINKSVKVKTSGNFVLKDREQFTYNVNLFNKIMPEVELNDLVFNPQISQDEKNEPVKIDMMKILNGLYDYKVTANTDINLKTDKENINGTVKVDNISIIGLTPSNLDLAFKNQSLKIDSKIYTASNEVSTLIGEITTGKKTYLDMNFKSDADIKNLLNIVKKVALIFDIKDLQTLSANGRINANFQIKSDLKTLSSNGFLKIPAANLYYGLYKVGIDNINADILLNNNNVNIRNIGFSILGQPLKIYGTLTKDAVADIHAIADKLSLKGLLVAFGQASLMKENPVYSGVISMDATIKGKLDKINPVLKLDISNIDLKNIPSDIRIKLPSTSVNITSDGKTFGGSAQSLNIQLINPCAKILVPNLKANITPELIEITQTPVTIENIKTTISGKITNYLTEKTSLDFVTTGDIQSTLKGDLNALKQTLNLNYATTDLSTIVIPMFDKSKMSFKGNINITGNMVNPVLSGNLSVPTVSLPEIPVSITNMDVKLHDTIMHGSASVQEFASGGIKAENLTGDFELKGNDFYLKNLNGTAFSGKIGGNILYNLSNAKTKIEFKGSGLNAEKAVEGAVGIKNALSGTLGFDTNLTLTVLDYNDMIKSMKGNLNFDIKDGAFGSIGRIDSFFKASNIVNNVLLKNTVSAITNAAGLADAAKFNTLEGKLTFSDGWANLNPIKSAGSSLCYYVTGKFNLINMSTNVVILGRLDAPIVAKLGPIGELSATKLLGNIPVFGTATANILNTLTTNPAGEKVSEIPDLTNGSKNYKDFKVVFNGGIESTSAVKSFKWLSQPDMSQIETKTTTEVLKDIKQSFTSDIQTQKDKINEIKETNIQKYNETKEAIKTTKEDLKTTVEDLKNTTSDLKNLWNGIKSGKSTTPSATTETTQTEN